MVLASPLLTSLDVSGCPWPTLSHFNQLSQAWPVLRSLSLSTGAPLPVTDETSYQHKELPSTVNFITHQLVSAVGKNLVDLTVYDCTAAPSNAAIISIVKVRRLIYIETFTVTSALSNSTFFIY
jgi:hypothetical protein